MFEIVKKELEKLFKRKRYSRFYKVVKREGKKYTSAYADGKAKVKYIPGKWISAPRWLRRRGYHLTVFGSLKDAVFFKMNSVDHEIWEAEVEGRIYDLPPCRSLDAIREGKLGERTTQWLLGTEMVRKIKLVKKVDTIYFAK